MPILPILCVCEKHECNTSPSFKNKNQRKFYVCKKRNLEKFGLNAIFFILPHLKFPFFFCKLVMQNMYNSLNSFN